MAFARGAANQLATRDEIDSLGTGGDGDERVDDEEEDDEEDDEGAAGSKGVLPPMIALTFDLNAFSLAFISSSSLFCCTTLANCIIIDASCLTPS